MIFPTQQINTTIILENSITIFGSVRLYIYFFLNSITYDSYYSSVRHHNNIWVDNSELLRFSYHAN